MNFRTLSIGLATAVAVTIGTDLVNSSAQAATLDGKLTGILSFDLNGLNLVDSVESTGVNLVNTSFTLASGAGTDDFETYTSGQFVNDLPTSLVGGNLEFLKLTGGIEGDVTFYLQELLVPNFTEIGAAGDGLGEFSARLKGVFQPFNQAGISTDDFVVTFRKKTGNGGTIEITPIPTPALLPAALGMGVAALRKKRKQEADADLASDPVEA